MEVLDTRSLDELLEQKSALVHTIAELLQTSLSLLQSIGVQDIVLPVKCRRL